MSARRISPAHSSLLVRPETLRAPASWAVALCVVATACGGPEASEPLQPLRPALAPLVEAVDLDPDPGVVEVHLAATEAQLDYRGDGRETAVLAYRDVGRPGSAASVPGPLITVPVGALLRVRFTNEMQERTTTIHWHGLRLPATMDGNPMVQGAVYPGESFTYEFVAQDASLFWYHPHVEPDEQMELGLHGPLLVRGGDEPTVATERVLVLDDVDLADDGEVRLEADMEDIMLGRHGAVILVNGQEVPSIVADGGATERWRIVNAANGRFFALTLPGVSWTVIGGDGGALAEPYTTDALLLSPGERLDVLVVMPTASERLMLRTEVVERGHSVVPAADVLEVVTVDPRSPPEVVDPGRFTRAIEPLEVDATTPVRTIALQEDLERPGGPLFMINDEVWPFNTPMSAVLGDLEVWRVENDNDGAHPFHLHGFFFQVLDRDGVPEPRLAWKDTVRIDAHSTIELAVELDVPGHWMFHCQIPEHAEGGMMGDLHVASPSPARGEPGPRDSSEGLP